MYADVDSIGRISVFEMERRDAVAIRAAVSMAIPVWESSLKEYSGIPMKDMPVPDIMRKLYLEQSIDAARKVAGELGQIIK